MSRKRERERWKRLLDELREWRIVVEDGLSEAETAAVEDRFGFRFPPDLRSLLHVGLPSTHGLSDWRRCSHFIHLDAPLAGFQHEIERGDFWLPEWGPRPESLDEAFQIAAQAVASAPRLIPVSEHNYIPASPEQAGNPVFFVYSSCVRIVGNDLLSYFASAFPGVARWCAPPSKPRPIRFWSDLVW